MSRRIPDATAPRSRRRWRRRVLSGLGIVAVLWGTAAYLALPMFWTYRSHQPGLASKPMITLTKQGIHGDPINIGLVGSKQEILIAMKRAGWFPADAITLMSSFKIGSSVVFNRAYPAAPISNLYYEGKPQALGFERAEGNSAKRRHHMRFWLSLQTGAEGRPVWLGAASFDRGVGLSHYTLQITHRVAPDLDAERDLVMADLEKAQVLQTIYRIAGIGPTADGHNGGGDPYFTDGDVAIGVLTPAAAPKPGAPDVLPDPAPVEAKNRVWRGLVDLGRRLHILPALPGETSEKVGTVPNDERSTSIDRLP